MCESQGQGCGAGPSPGSFLTAAAASSTAVESTGTAKAEAESRSEAARIEGEGSVLQAKLKAEALAIETVSGAGAHGRGRPRDLEEARSLQSQEDTTHPTTQPYSHGSPLPSISSLNTCKDGCYTHLPCKPAQTLARFVPGSAYVLHAWSYFTFEIPLRQMLFHFTDEEVEAWLKGLPWSLSQRWHSQGSYLTHYEFTIPALTLSSLGRAGEVTCWPVPTDHTIQSMLAFPLPGG